MAIDRKVGSGKERQRVEASTSRRRKQAWEWRQRVNEWKEKAQRRISRQY